MKRAFLVLLFIITLVIPTNVVLAEGKYSFYDISGFTFGCPKEWPVIDERNDQIMFEATEGDDLYVAIKVIPFDHEGQIDDYFADYATNEAEKHSDYSYSYKIYHDEPVLFQTYTEEGQFFLHNITEIDGYFIHAICMSGHEIPPIMRAQINALIVPLKTPEEKK